MPSTILKQEVPGIASPFTLIPREGEMVVQALHLGRDGTGQMCVWFSVRDDKPGNHIPRGLEVFVVGTGMVMSGPMDHISTCIDRQYVWHLMRVARRDV